MLRRSAIFLAAVAIAGCDDQFGNDEPFDPIADSWDLDVRGVNVDAANEGARVVVAVYNRTDDSLEARSDSAVEGGRFRFYFDHELENGKDYSVYYWLDLGTEGECEDDTIYIVDLDNVRDHQVVLADPEVDAFAAGCDQVDGGLPALTD